MDGENVGWVNVGGRLFAVPVLWLFGPKRVSAFLDARIGRDWVETTHQWTNPAPHQPHQAPTKPDSLHGSPMTSISLRSTWIPLILQRIKAGVTLCTTRAPEEMACASAREKKTIGLCHIGPCSFFREHAHHPPHHPVRALALSPTPGAHTDNLRWEVVQEHPPTVRAASMNIGANQTLLCKTRQEG